MRQLLSLSLLFSMFFPHLASAVASVAPSAVLANPLAMTVTQTLAQPQNDRSTRSKITLIAERKKTFLLEDHGDLSFTYQVQANKNAPLIFIIPGTGGVAESAGALFLAEQLFALGYQTVTLDDAFSWKFAVAGSQSGLPGYTPQDSQDLYKALQAVNAKLTLDKKIHPSSYSLVGYSLGALQSLFMAHLDESEKSFQFRRVLMIDPPLDLLHAIKALDNLYATGESLSSERKLKVFNRVLDVGGKYINQKANFQDPGLLQSAFTELDLNNQDLAYLVGGSFRDSLRDVIFASQQIQDLKILKISATRLTRSQRYSEARNFSFMQYMNLFLYPEVKSHKSSSYSFEDLNKESSFYQFGDYVQSNKNLFIVHTADDFILKPGDIAWIQERFTDRAMIFPFGGHCGAMNFPAFTEYLKTIF